MGGINNSPVNSFPINGVGDEGGSVNFVEWQGVDFFVGADTTLRIQIEAGGEIIEVPPRDTSMRICAENRHMAIPCMTRHMVAPKDTEITETVIRVPCVRREMRIPYDCDVRYMKVPPVEEGCSE